MKEFGRQWNVLVIGGGHAGIEAAWAAARFAPVALMVSNPATIGRMPCNPAVGGPGKSQLVAEVTALGGLMGRVADETAIHTRMLNTSKGPAVHSLRIQNERDQYAERAQEHVLAHRNIVILRAEAADLSPDLDGWQVTSTDGRVFRARSVVIAAGTFLRAQTWYGRHTRAEGRQGEPPSLHLSDPLSRGGHRLKRYKTGTPPRIRADSVDFASLQEIPADPVPHSFTGTPGPDAARSPTWQTHTTPDTHRLIQENLHESPMYAGDIEGLSESLVAIVSQRLLPRLGGGRVLGMEILVGTSTVRDCIKDEQKTDAIKQALEEGSLRGMHTFDQHLVQLVQANLMTREDAMLAATSPHEVKINLMKASFA